VKTEAPVSDLGIDQATSGLLGGLTGGTNIGGVTGVNGLGGALPNVQGLLGGVIFDLGESPCRLR